MRLLSRFKSCTRCPCPTCRGNAETAAHEDEEARMYKAGSDAMLTASGETISDLERRLNRSRAFAQLFAIATGLYTIVFYAKYGW